MKPKSLVRLGALAILWGSGFLFIKEALGGLSPFQIVFGRLLAAAVAMLALTLATKRRLPTDRRIWIHLGVMAIITNIAPYFLFAWGELRVTSGLAGVLNATTPLFTLMAALATGTERNAPSRLAGLVLGLLGVVILAAPWATPQRSTLAGILAALLASACYALGYVYARRFLTSRAVAPVVLSTGQMLAGCHASRRARYMESRTGRRHDPGWCRPVGRPATPPSLVSPPQTTGQALEACSSP